jgi:hypothetical protein
VVAQNPFRGFFQASVDKKILKTDVSTVKSFLSGSTVIFRPAVEVNYVEITKSTIPGEALHTQSLTKAGVGLSLAFFNGLENNFSINALALMPTDFSGETKFSISPAVSVVGWGVLNLGLGYDTGFKRVFGMLGIGYNFSKVK